MATKRIFKRLPLVVAGLAMGLGVFISVDGFRPNKQAEETTAYYTPSTHYEVSDTASELNSYYSSISSGDTGTTLLSKLQSLNSTKRKKTMGYSTMGTSISSSPYSYTDYDMNNTAVDSNGQIYGTKVASFYTKTSATDWNREHVWPNSRGGSSVEGDILHTRPTISSENSSRGNSMYVEGKNSSSAGWDPYTAGYDAACRGECARIILYSVVASTSLSLVAADNDDTSNKTMGNMNTLIKWHFDYSPSVYEINRNNGAEYLQGNRNPFVDHPEYVARIWSSFNSTISTLCNNNASMYENWVPGSASTYGTNDAVDATGVSISKTSVSLTVGNSTTISATSSNSSTITWSTSNNSVASISSTSAASGSNITITANAAGSATITAKATISGVQYTKTCSVTVTTSGGSGGQSEEGDDYSITPSDLDTAYPTTATNYTASSGISFTAYNTANFSSKVQFKKSGGYLYNNSSLNLGTLTLSGLSGTLTIYAGSSKNPSSTTITGSNGIYDLTGYNYFKIINNSSSVATCSSITVGIASSSTKTLSSISVATAPTKTSYTAGEYFNPSGLVINRNYSDSTSDTYTYSGHTSEFTFSPTTSTALTTSHTSVTINYGGKSCSQSITVTQPAATSITASVSKTYYVGETISTSDITVKDNNNNTVNSFTFANDGYQFTYADASSGGASTNKTFSNSITNGNLKCGLSVNVARKAYITPSSPVSDVITASDLTATSTSYSNFSNVAKSSSARYAGQSAKNSAGAIQMRSTSPSGLVSTASGGTISSVTITVNSGTNTISVYGKNTAYSSSSDLYTTSTQGTLVGTTSSTGTINFATGYAYVGIRSSSGAIYLTNITITYGSGETAKNVANYIMYADTNGQCTSKLTTAVGYIYNMSSSEKTLFQNSDDYVISTARTRINAWAANQGKVINYSSGTLSNASNVVSFATSGNNNAITLVIIISMVGTSSIGICLYIRKKRFHI